MKFPVRFYPEGKWWMAEVPDLDSVTQGEDLEEARFMAADETGFDESEHRVTLWWSATV